MKMMFKYFFGAMSILAGTLFADIHDRIEYKLNRVLREVENINNGNVGNCTPITQYEIDEGGGIFIASHSGPYCLTQDVFGTIVLAADSICLDLGCHKVDADDAHVAIQVLGNDCSIQNGTVGGTVGSTSRVISADSVSGLQVNNVHFSDFESFGMYGESLAHFVICNCIFRDGGEAIFLSDSNVGLLVGHRISGIVNREANQNAMVELIECDCIEIYDVEICDNYKDYVDSPSNPFSGAFFLAYNSSHLIFEKLVMHNLQPDGANPGSAATGMVDAAFVMCESIEITDSIFTLQSYAPGLTAVGLVMYQSGGALLENVLCNKNTNFAGPMALAAGFISVACTDILADSCQFNQSTAPAGGNAAGAFVVVGSSSIHFNNCQFSNNRATQFEGVGLAIFDSIHCSATHCTAFGNSSNSFSFQGGIGYSLVNCSGNTRCTLERATNSSFENITILNNASGSAFEISNGQGLLLRNCVAQGCASGNGFLLFAYNAGLEFDECVAEQCAGSGFSVDLFNTSAVLIKSCQAVNNAVFGFQFPANASNNTITNCCAINNSTGNYSVDVPAPLIFTVDSAGTIVGVSDYFHNLSRV